MGRMANRRLRRANGPGKGQVYEVEEEKLCLGRDTSAGVQLLDKGASRFHAEVFRIGELCFIRDLGSRNGTYINNQRVTDELLRDGDNILIGSTIIEFESGEGEEEERRIEFAESTGVETGSSLELNLDDLYLETEAVPDTHTTSLRVVYHIGKLRMEERDRAKFLKAVLDYISGYLAMDNGYVFLREAASKNLKPAARYERSAEDSVKISRTIIKRAVSELRSVLTSDAMTDARFRSQDSIIMNKIRSVICVPLVSAQEVRGVLYLTCSRLGELFTEGDLELATAVGSQLSLALENIEYSRKVHETLMSAVRTLVAISERRNPATEGHSERVCSYSAAIVSQIGLGQRDQYNVQLSALLHDIGKATVSEKALKTDSREMDLNAEVMEHVIAGAEIAKNIVGVEEVPPAIRRHHERHDGSGYPDGLKGDEIPLAARVIAVGDEFDHRARELSLKEALVQTRELSGTKLHPDAVKALMTAYTAGVLLKPATIFESEGTAG